MFLEFMFATPTSVGQAPVATASNIEVIPTVSASGPTVAFSAPGYFSLSGAESVTYGIDYTVDPGPVIGGESLSLDPPEGAITITETSCPASGYPCSDVPQYTESVTTEDPNASVSFPNASIVGIALTIQITSTEAQPAGFDSLASDTDVSGCNAVPEPKVAGLTVAGLFAVCGLVWVRRCRALALSTAMA